MAKHDEKEDKEEKKEKDSEESEEKEPKKEEEDEKEETPEEESQMPAPAESGSQVAVEDEPQEAASSAPKPTAEELLHSELPKVSPEEGAEDHDGYSSDSEQKEAGNEHTLNDLAAEDVHSGGVDPSRPKSFMMDQDTPTNLNQQIPSSGVYGGRNKGGKKKTVMLLIIALLVVGGLIYLLKGRILGSKSEASPSPSPTIAEETPTPTPTAPSIDRSKYTVDVLNGSGKTGLAASVSAKLKDLGYKAGKTGNASNSAFTKTQVLAKNATSQDVIDALIKDLSPDYSAVNGGALGSTSTADLEVIIGAK